MKHNRATDHRALVLESIATAPALATKDGICADCVDTTFTRKMVLTMAAQLVYEGLVMRVATPEGVCYALTDAGMERLMHGTFDRALPATHERPKGRKPRKRKEAS